MSITDLHGLATAYQVLARGFDHPAAGYWEALEGRSLADLAALDGDDEGSVFPRRSQEERETEYFTHFETGAIPLYEGACCRDKGREGLQEELLRFYHFFGLKLSEERRDFPDHFVTELQFMWHLVHLEAEAAERGEDPSPFRAAQRDFLERHVLVWSGVMRSRHLDDRSLLAYRLLIDWLCALAASHHEALAEPCTVLPN